VLDESQVSGKTGWEPLSEAATVQNRLTGFTYDAAGNMTQNGSVAYTYDAENRLTSTAGYTYVYDADGNRVEKCNITPCPTSGTNGTLYWRGTGSDTLDETDLSGNALEEYTFFNGRRIARRDISTNTVHYYFSDNLGTHSLITDQYGTMPPQEESDYYPYGGEIPVSGSDPNHYKFTGKERDSESGLDNFGARFDASTLGRFMSPDGGAFHFANPQSFNRYVYALNNPLRFIDPDGNDPIDETLMNNLLNFNSFANANLPAAADAVNSVLGGGATPAGLSPASQGILNNARAMVANTGGDLPDEQAAAGAIMGNIAKDAIRELSYQMQADQLLSQLTIWSNLQSTTAGDIGQAYQKIDQNLRALEEPKQRAAEVWSLFSKIIGVFGPYGAAAAGTVDVYSELSELERGFQEYVLKQAEAELNAAAERKKKPKCGSQTDNPSGQTNPLTSTQPCSN
jgi:RHS repeat-associated protein